MANPGAILSNAAIRGAYGRAQSLGGAGDATATGAAGAAGGESFAQMVRGAAEQAAQTVRQADAVAQAGLQGKVGTQQVVEATLAMESTVKITVAMRNKLVEAYQEIMRMPI